MASFSAFFRSLVQRTAAQARDRGASAPEYALILTIMVASTLVVLGQLEENTEDEVVSTASQIGALPTIIGFVPVETTIPLPTVAPTPPPTTVPATTVPPVTTLPPSAGSDIIIRARSREGFADMSLLIDDVPVKSWGSVTSSWDYYNYTHTSAVDHTRIKVAYSNDSGNRYLALYSVEIDGVLRNTFQDPELFTKGTWTGPGGYYSDNEWYSRSRAIHGNGWMTWKPKVIDLDCNHDEFNVFGRMGHDDIGGSKYLQRRENDGNTTYGGPDYATCVLEVTNPGVYKIRGNVRGNGGDSNEWGVEINGSPSARFDWEVPSGGFVDDFMSTSASDPVELEFLAGTHTVTLFPNEDGVHLRNLELVYVRPPGPVEKLVCNAPDFTLTGNMQLGATGGTQYIYTPNGTGTSYNSPTNDRGTCTFKVSEAGRYRIDGLVSAPNGSDDSFWVLWKGNTIQWRTGSLSSGAFFVDAVSQWGGVDPVEVDLAAGDHEVIVTRREDGTHLSSLTLVKVN